MNNFDLNYYYDDEDIDYLEGNDVFGDYESIYSNPHDLKATFETCILPSVKQVSSYILVLLASCLICRSCWFISERVLQKGEWLQHWISLVCGLIALFTSIGRSVWIIFLLSILSYSVLMLVVHLKSTHILRLENVGVVVGAITITTNLMCEAASENLYDWNSIRGIQMIITMKVISLGFDMETDESKEKKQTRAIPFFVPYLGYVFCPGTCLHGPWLPFNVYVRSMEKSANGIVQGAIWTIFNILFALGTLSVSNCLAPLLCSERSYKWIRAYRDALTVRTSHYFISFLSQATLAASGLSWDPAAAPNPILGFVVAKPWTIEFPRSISSIVRNWNIPMHSWLKIYVFRRTQIRSKNYLVAVLVTYVVSSLLHGLYYQIYAILFSLGCFAYVEYLLRKKLAFIFDACIGSTPCRKYCLYTHCNRRPCWYTSHSAWLVLVFNLLFGFLTVFHLAYLGVMLNANEDGKISFKDSLTRWHQLDFFNHWSNLVFFAFYCLI